jgi:hypothetical protein
MISLHLSLEVGDLKYEKDSTCYYRFEDEGDLVANVGSPWLIISKMMGTSILQ